MKTLMKAMSEDFDAGRAAGKEEAAWAILALLVRERIPHDPAAVLAAARA